ncbi:MAG: prepilin-type N-terminal cleavage/methylation domain-containing protein [bacterium]
MTASIRNIKTSNKGLDGFTLLELLVVLSLLSIVLSVAMPRFAGTLSQMSLKKKQQRYFQH